MGNLRIGMYCDLDSVYLCHYDSTVPVLLKKGAALILALVLFVGLVLLVGAEHMDKAYHQKKYHVERSVIGMVLGLIPCLMSGVIVQLIG